MLLSTGQGVLGNNAYAYCNNNPVNMEDVGGCLPIPSLADLIMIHNKVACSVAIYVGACIIEEHYTTTFIKGGGYRGYLDVFNKDTGYYYEIKSVYEYERYIGGTSNRLIRQLMKYTFIGNLAEKNNLAMFFTSGTDERIKGGFTHKNWQVKYWYADPGVVCYSHEWMWEAPERSRREVPVIGVDQSVLLLGAACITFVYGCSKGGTGGKFGVRAYA